MVPLIWPLVCGMLQRAIDHSHGELDQAGVYKSMVNGDMLLVTITREKEIVAAIAMEQRNFDTGKKILNLTLVGGDSVHEWMEQIDEITLKLAKDYGCTEIYLIGRRGWTKLLKKVGYEVIHTVVRKKVGG